MGWFWADANTGVAATASSASSHHLAHHSFPVPHPRDGENASPPPGCPMHKNQRTIDALNPSPKRPAASSSSSGPPSSCPVPHGQRSSDSSAPQKSTLSRLNPLNYMFRDISQAPAPNQSQALPTSRDASSIPKGTGDGNWEYPSPQQMYNALLRKGYTDTDVTAVESMVAVHNFLNEGAWMEIVEWEKRFGKGLSRGWEICRRGEENAEQAANRLAALEGRDASQDTPTLIRFQGRPKDMTPKAAMIQVMGWLYPAKFGTEPPFDRHDWFVSRNINGQAQQVRYVIDYYTGPPEPTGEPVFYLDVRPAMTPTGAVERLMRWGGDVWWKASGGEVREANLRQAAGK